MREKHAGEVTLDTTGDVLVLFLSFMYGRLETVPGELLLPLFELADCHQVGQFSFCP